MRVALEKLCKVPISVNAGPGLPLFYTVCATLKTRHLPQARNQGARQHGKQCWQSNGTLHTQARWPSPGAAKPLLPVLSFEFPLFHF